MFKNYKTTLAGIFLAAANVIVMGFANGTVTKENIAVSTMVAILGFLTKDYDTTGVGERATKP